MAYTRTTPEGTVYLLHFDSKYHHAQHYIGWTSQTLNKRLLRHFTGAGARLLQVVTEAGIPIHVARTWAGNRTLERSLKNQKNARRFCPVCLRTKN